MPDQDVVKGKIKQGLGKVQEEIGKKGGSVRDIDEGQAKQAEGKAQEGIGRVKDAARDIVDTVKRNI